MSKLKWILLVTVALFVGLLTGTVALALSLLMGSWLPAYMVIVVVGATVAFAIVA